MHFVPADELKDMDAVIIAVAHAEFAAYTPERIDAFFAGGGKAKVLLDLKGILDRASYEAKSDYLYWRL